MARLLLFSFTTQSRIRSQPAATAAGRESDDLHLHQVQKGLGERHTQQGTLRGCLRRVHGSLCEEEAEKPWIS